MTPQLPAEGIMITKSFPDSTFAKLHCDCGDNNHTVDLAISKEDGTITLEIYSNTQTPYWNDKLLNGYSRTAYLVNSIWHKLKMTFRLWTTGYLEYESHTILSDQSATNLAHFLLNTIDSMKS